MFRGVIEIRLFWIFDIVLRQTVDDNGRKRRDGRSWTNHQMEEQNQTTPLDWQGIYSNPSGIRRWSQEKIFRFFIVQRNCRIEARQTKQNLLVLFILLIVKERQQHENQDVHFYENDCGLTTSVLPPLRGKKANRMLSLLEIACETCLTLLVFRTVHRPRTQRHSLDSMAWESECCTTDSQTARWIAWLLRKSNRSLP